jgi:predicted Rossmann fold nucleotide-binding protein DprA/Smf involved in DNA uptake
MYMSLPAQTTGSKPVSGNIETAVTPVFAMPPAYHLLWQALGYATTDMDRLAGRTGLTTAALSSMLPMMELQGY